MATSWAKSHLGPRYKRPWSLMTLCSVREVTPGGFGSTISPSAARRVVVVTHCAAASFPATLLAQVGSSASRTTWRALWPLVSSLHHFNPTLQPVLPQASSRKTHDVMIILTITPVSGGSGLAWLGSHECVFKYGRRQALLFSYSLSLPFF